MISPPPSPTRLFFGGYLAALAAAALVLGGHLWMVENAGSPVPVHDQWAAEGEMLFSPLVQDRLTIDAIVHPHAEHRIIPTRLLAVALFRWNHQQWDVRLQMTVNALLAATLVALTVVMASRQLGRNALLGFAALGGALFASPLFYGNALWGFQSQFYFLLLFSVAHLDLVLRQRVLSIPWAIGMGCALLGWVSMGSGFFSAGIVTLMAAWSLARGPRGEERRAALINFTLHLAICVAAFWWRPAVSPLTVDWSATLHTFVHCLSWPQRYYSPWGLWVWLPYACFIGSLIARTNLSKNDQVALALGLWVLAQILAISLVRTTPTLVITPRYYEIFWLGLVANVLALHRLGQIMQDRQYARGLRVLLALLTIGWLAAVSYKAWTFADSHGRHDLPAYRNFAHSQVRQVRAYLATGDSQVLQTLPYPQVPHPDSAYLARVLRDPVIRGILPSELSDSPPGPLSKFAAAVRRTWFGWIVMGVVLLIVDLGHGWTSARRRGAFR